MKKFLRRHIFHLLNFYPPYFFTGIKVIAVNEDRTKITVQMRLRCYNKNGYGTHFGGSIYSMVDPFYALLLWYHLGDQYKIWDKSAKIEYLRPSKSSIYAHCALSNEEIKRLKEVLLSETTIEPTYQIVITDQDKKEVAKIEKTLSIRANNNGKKL